MSDVPVVQRCPNTFCNVALLPLADQVEINRIAAAEGKLHTTHPLAGFTFTYQGKKLCHACSEMYKAVIGKTWWINAEADDITFGKRNECEVCGAFCLRFKGVSRCWEHKL